MSGEDTGPAEDPPGGAASAEGAAGDAAPPGPAAEAPQDAAGEGVAGDRPAGLGELDRQILALENLQWKYQGAKEMEIRRRLGLSPTHYYQRLNVLIDTRAALEHDPMLVGRLRRQREDRA